MAPKLLVVLQPTGSRGRCGRWDKALPDGGTFLPGALGKKIRKKKKKIRIGNCAGAELCPGIASHRGDTLGPFFWTHSSGLCPLQQVRRLHLEMMSCFQLFIAMDVSQVPGEL